MTYLPWYAGGLALATIAVVHRLVVGKSLAVSGRLGAIVDRVRHGPAETVAMEDDELIRALQAATAAEFGTPTDSPEAASSAPAPIDRATALASEERRAGLAKDVAFLGGLFLGGLLIAVVWKTYQPIFALRGEGLARLATRLHLPSPALLLLGGIMVGFGTRMAGGCTSGHGLCGVSRVQRGSLVTTATFFGVGIAVSYLIEALS